MVPDTTIQYSILKDPRSVITPLKKLTPRIREKINDAIDSLQINPRPPKHEIIQGLGSVPTVKLTVIQGWYIMYQVDDQKMKIYILSVGRFLI